MKRILFASLLVVAGFAITIWQIHQSYAAPLPGPPAGAARPTSPSRQIAPNAIRGGGPSRTVIPTPVVFPSPPPGIDPTGFSWFGWSRPGGNPGGFFGPGGGGGGGGPGGGAVGLTFAGGEIIVGPEGAFPGTTENIATGIGTVVTCTVQVVDPSDFDKTQDCTVGIGGGTIVVSEVASWTGGATTFLFFPGDKVRWFAMGF